MNKLESVLARPHLPALDGLRAVAVFTVMVFHAGYSGPADLGVTGFFVLSGFLITWLLLKELRRTGEISFRSFYLRRTLRIFPAYYAVVIASIVADRLLGDPWTTGEVAAAFGYVVNYYNAFQGHEGTLAHAWSLAVEEQFYLVWPVAFILLARRGEATLRRGLVMAIVAVACWRSVGFLALGFSTAYTYNAFDTRFDSLAVGCLLAVLAQGPAFGRLAGAAAARPWLPLATLAALMASRLGGTETYRYALGFTVDSLLMALLIVQLLQLHESRLWRWLEIPAVRYLGTISYPLYLWHAWALGVGHWFTAAPLSVRFLIGAAVAVAVASGSYYLIERPMLALRPQLERRLLRREPRLARLPAASGA